MFSVCQSSSNLIAPRSYPNRLPSWCPDHHRQIIVFFDSTPILESSAAPICHAFPKSCRPTKNSQKIKKTKASQESTSSVLFWLSEPFLFQSLEIQSSAHHSITPILSTFIHSAFLHSAFLLSAFFLSTSFLSHCFLSSLALYSLI